MFINLSVFKKRILKFDFINIPDVKKKENAQNKGI